MPSPNSSATTADPVFLSAGDTALVVQFGETIDREINRRVTVLGSALRSAAVAGVVDIVPTFRSLMVHYDPLAVSGAALRTRIEALLEVDAEVGGVKRRWRIPVCYGGEHGPDLDGLAETIGLSVADAIEAHTTTPLDVFMMGFLPGFPYLGVLDEVFDVPRLVEPRVKVPARSVSVAQRQTTIYTIESPGGWHLVGRTPVEFYDPHRDNPILVDAGDQILFYAVDQGEYESIRETVTAGTWTPDVEEFEL